MTPLHPDKPLDRRRVALVYALALAALWLAAPRQIVDLDALSRLSVGRLIAQTGEVPSTDPFTFTRPGARWSNPEWGGDLLWYAAHWVDGFRATVALKLFLAGLGWGLALIVALRGGARPALVLALLLIVIPAAGPRLHVRNEVHALWLIPAYMLLLSRASGGWRTLWPVALLGLLWANLHSSFVVGWVLIAATFLDQWVARASTPQTSPDADTVADPEAEAPAAPAEPSALPWLAGLLVLHFVFPLISPNGIHAYDQLIDHVRGAGIYGQAIMEWQAPEQVRVSLTQLPLHALGIIGLLSFLPRLNRRRLGALLRIGAALALGHGSQRFGMLLAVLAVPDIAINLYRWLSCSSLLQRRLWTAALVFCGLCVALPTIWTARVAPAPAVFARHDAPLAAAQFMRRHAPTGTRLFNPYNSGPYLLWAAGPHVQIYIDPRNNLGAELLYRYVTDILPNPEAFEREVRGHNIDLALVDLGDGRLSALARHLARTKDWQLVFFDGRFGLYGRPLNGQRQGRAAQMTAQHAYRAIRATLDFDRLPAGGDVALETDRQRLAAEAPALARALEGYLLLVASGGTPPTLGATTDPAATRRATELLAAALPKLPPSPALMSYLATAYARSGNHKACLDVLGTAEQLFSGDPRLVALRATLQKAAQQETDQQEADQ